MVTPVVISLTYYILYLQRKYATAGPCLVGCHGKCMQNSMGGFGVAYLAVGAGAGDIVAFVGRHSGGRIIKVVVDSGERNDEAEKGGAG